MAKKSILYVFAQVKRRVSYEKCIKNDISNKIVNEVDKDVREKHACTLRPRIFT